VRQEKWGGNDLLRKTRAARYGLLRDEVIKILDAI